LLKGKMLRLDVDGKEGGLGYAIPPDNPFVGRSNVRPEIWVSGLREPWRFSFDPLTNDLWVGEVGQDRYEEVTIIRRGENHGWNVWEGFERFSNQYRIEGTRFIQPVFAYPRKRGNCIIGGHVYRVDPQSSYYGVYVFGDHNTRHLWGLTQTDRQLKKVLKIGTSPQKIVSFGRSTRGDLFLVGYEGTIFRIELDEAVFAE
jgi:glucose/arabinose dehydrogenase